MTPEQKLAIAADRLKRKLEEKNHRIAGLEKRIRELESQVARATHFEKDLYRIVQSALCNVRMLPAYGIGKDSKIVEVTVKDKE